MDVPGWLWAATIAGIALVVVCDLVLVDTKEHAFTTKEATGWVLFYLASAGAFAVFIGVHFGSTYAGQFVAGYLTEYSLSVDNLFIFLVIMSSFAVPEIYRHRVLLVGVVIALILRGILIAVGAAAIQRFAVTFFAFGGFLLWTAWSVARSGGEHEDAGNNMIVRLAERFLPTTREYHGHKLTVRIDGQRLVTPMALVMLSIGTTDLLFALDSIPAVYGLTREPYLVFAANAFALMGLRQLFFLLHGLMGRLIYLSQGLALILAFIGVKLILEALGETTDVDVPHISIALSLSIIIGILGLTAIISLAAVRRNPELARTSPESRAETRAVGKTAAELAYLRDLEHNRPHNHEPPP